MTIDRQQAIEAATARYNALIRGADNILPCEHNAIGAAVDAILGLSDPVADAARQWEAAYDVLAGRWKDDVESHERRYGRLHDAARELLDSLWPLLGIASQLPGYDRATTAMAALDAALNGEAQ